MAASRRAGSPSAEKDLGTSTRPTSPLLTLALGLGEEVGNGSGQGGGVAGRRETPLPIAQDFDGPARVRGDEGLAEGEALQKYDPEGLRLDRGVDDHVRRLHPERHVGAVPHEPDDVAVPGRGRLDLLGIVRLQGVGPTDYDELGIGMRRADLGRPRRTRGRPSIAPDGPP